MQIYDIAKKLHCILNRTDEITSKHLDATISIGNIALIECDETSCDNIYIYLNSILAEHFDELSLYGNSNYYCDSYKEVCKETEIFLDGLRDKYGNFIYWCFVNPFTIFIKVLKDGYLSRDISEYMKKEIKDEKKMEEYQKWRMQKNYI